MLQSDTVSEKLETYTNLPSIKLGISRTTKVTTELLRQQLQQFLSEWVHTMATSCLASISISQASTMTAAKASAFVAAFTSGTQARLQRWDEQTAVISLRQLMVALRRKVKVHTPSALKALLLAHEPTALSQDALAEKEVTLLQVRTHCLLNPPLNWLLAPLSSRWQRGPSIEK